MVYADKLRKKQKNRAYVETQGKRQQGKEICMLYVLEFMRSPVVIEYCRDGWCFRLWVGYLNMTNIMASFIQKFGSIFVK